MTTSTDFQIVPRSFLLGAGCLIAVILVAALTARLTDVGATRLSVGAFVESRALIFSDAEKGVIQVRDLTDPNATFRIEPGGNGFVRVAMRSMARERFQRGIGEEQPFRIGRDAEQRYWLEDMATGRRIGLDAFGAGNARSFTQLLTFGKAAP